MSDQTLKDNAVACATNEPAVEPDNAVVELEVQPDPNVNAVACATNEPAVEPDNAVVELEVQPDVLPPAAEPESAAPSDAVATEPAVDAVTGMVQPDADAMPPAQGFGRVTNQLQYLVRVLQTLWMHEFASPFKVPENYEDYDECISAPIDLTIIRTRLESNYYWSGNECIEDFNRMFTNCYVYHSPDAEMVKMAQDIEQMFLTLIEAMPRVEVAIKQETV